jgi:hypothetical protein
LIRPNLVSFFFHELTDEKQSKALIMIFTGFIADFAKLLEVKGPYQYYPGGALENQKMEDSGIDRKVFSKPAPIIDNR